MPTQDVTIPITFAQGLDTKTDPKSVIPGRLLDVQNGVFTKGSIIQKRYGLKRLGSNIFNSGTLTPSPGAALNLFQSELLTFTGNRMYSRSENNDALIDRGVATSVQVANKAIQGAPNRDIQRATSTVNQGIGAYAWWDGAAIWATVIDEKSGTRFMIQNISTGYTPTGAFALFNASNYIYLIWGAGGSVYCHQLAILNPNKFTLASTLATDADSANPMLDAAEFGTNAFVAYRNGSGVASMFFIIQGNVATVSQGYPGIVSTSETVGNCLSVFTDGVSLYLAWANGFNGVRVQGFNTQLVSRFTSTVDAVISPSTVNITGYVQGTTLQLFYEMRQSIDVNQWTKQAAIETVGGTVTSTPAVFRRSVGLAAKAFLYAGQGYVPTVFWSATQSTYFVYSAQGNRVAKMLPGEAGSYQAQSFLSRLNVASDNFNAFTFANLRKVQVTDLNGGLYFNRGVTRSTITFFTNNAFAAAQLGQNLHVVGGNLFDYDGRNIVEHGFDVFPEGQSLSASISTTSGSIGSGSVTNTGLWSYFFTYRWMDGQSQLHESPPSFAQQVTLTGSTNAVTWTIPTLRVTDKVSGSIAVYRSQQNTSDPAYMITALSGVFNDTSIDSVTFTDTYSDAAIGSKAIIYTAGGVLENDAPPACSAVVTNKNRIWLIPSENPYQLVYSKEFVKDAGVSFPLAFTLDIDPRGGPATALASMRNELIVFKETSIYLVEGDGPDALGSTANGDFGLPQLVSNDVGCINPASICVTALGIFFQSQKGIYLLGTGLSAPQYVGAPVEKWNSYAVTSATLLADVNQVRFSLSNNGPTLLYDYYFGQWSTLTGLHQNVSDSIIYNNAYTVLEATGKMYREDATTYQDDNRNVQLVLQTAWIKLNAQVLQGFQRCKKMHLLGSFGSPHALLVQVAYDYDDSVRENITFNTQDSLNNSTWGSSPTWGSGSLWGSDSGADNRVYQFRHNLSHQKCEAVRFTFTDAYAPGLGEGYSLNELLLTIGMKKGAYKLQGRKSI